MAKKPVKPWHNHNIVQLRPDIKSGELSLKAFAADLYDVMLGHNPGVYHNPKEFFSLTYPTVRMRDLVRDVTHRLAGQSEKAVRHLHTTFGGGKTHSLIALVHLVSEPENLPDIPAVEEFKSHCGLGNLPKARVAAVVFDRLDAEKGMEVKAPDGALRTLKMPWSVLAWQLAGDAGLKVLKDDGSERPSPPATNVIEELLRRAIEAEPSVLILFDEVLWFVRTMVDQDPEWEGRMANFLHSLTQAVTKVPRCCLVASLMASDTRKMDELGKKISRALYDEFSRVADEGVQPVEKGDVPEILRRQLFTKDNRDQWPKQVYAVLNSIQTVDEDTKKRRAEEEKKYKASYPFHPDLVELLHGKWVQLEGFQQTRGVLKTLATALRNAEEWDQQPIIGAQVFLAAEDGLSEAARELANIAKLEQYEGRQQDWPPILEAELKHAKGAQEGLDSLQCREIEQAVLATFLHSQPIGQLASTRELKQLIASGMPDSIELDKGLARWAENSWYLDDTYIDEQEDGLPKSWRLGSKPNLKQMHHDAREQFSLTVLDDMLKNQIRKTAGLTEGTRAAGVKTHMLPSQPSELQDDGDFHYAVLGPEAASESGAPSAVAKRFIDETTSPDRPRALNRNAIVLAVPSKEGIAAAREKVRDCVGWKKVREILQKKDDLDITVNTRLENNLRADRNEMGSRILIAYCIAVTVDRENNIAAYRITVSDTSLFTALTQNERMRIESTAIDAAALLPDGPYDLWPEGAKERFVKNLVGAFAATARLPKMLNRDAIMETILQGCEAGTFVLRVTRADRSVRTFWKTRPDEETLREPSMEVVLPDAAELRELDPAMLAPNALPDLWDRENEIRADLAGLVAYFSGGHIVEIDKGEYTEALVIPKAGKEVLKEAVRQAVKNSHIWLVNGKAGLFGEEVPGDAVNEQSTLYPPPGAISTDSLLPGQLDDAWTEEETTAQRLHEGLSGKMGKPLPWTSLSQALDHGFRSGHFVRTSESGAWPCDRGGAGSVKIRIGEPPSPSYDAPVATAELDAAEIQNLADQISDLKRVTAGKNLHLSVTIKLDKNGAADQKVVSEVNEILNKVKPGWEIK